MIVKMNEKDISDFLLSYKRSGSMNRIVGNAPTQSLKISLDNYSGLFDYKTVSDAIFEVQSTPDSNKYFFKVYEMPETWDFVLELTLYDCMYIFDVNYDTKLEYPVTIQSQLLEMQSITGIEIDYRSVDQSILQQETNQYDSTITIRSYLRWIGEISGCNIFASNNKYYGVHFERFSKNQVGKYNNLLNYKKGNPYVISKVSFNDGIRIFEEGTDESNVYFLSNDNIYITDHEHIKIVSDLLLGLSLHSVSKIEADYINDLTLGSIVNCFNEFSFVVLNLEETYVGGETPDFTFSGELSTENQEATGVKVNTSTKIRRLQVITDEQDLSLRIVAEQQENTNKQLSSFSLSIEDIKLAVERTQSQLVGVINYFRDLEYVKPIISESSSNTSAFVDNVIRFGIVEVGEFQLYDRDNFIESFADNERYSTSILLKLKEDSSVDAVDALFLVGDKSVNITITKEEQKFIIEDISFLEYNDYKLTFNTSGYYVDVSALTLVSGPIYQETAEGLYTMATQLKQNANNIEIVTKGLSKIQKDLGEYVTQDELEKYIIFNEGNGIDASITLKTSSSGFKVVITNKEIGFYENDTKIAWMSNQDLHINNAVIEESLEINDYTWKQLPNGSLALLYTGGEG